MATSPTTACPSSTRGRRDVGMYDYLYSRVPLPESDLPPGTAFQTKDLDRVLAHYVIDADGRLRRCGSMAEDEPDEAGAEDTEFHGDVRFYEHGPDGGWREFVARFTNGTLERVRRDREAERARHALRTADVGAADTGDMAERVRARFAPLGGVGLEFPSRGPASELSGPQPADTSDLRETPAEAERRVGQARRLKGQAREGGLRFSAYLPPGLA